MCNAIRICVLCFVIVFSLTLTPSSHSKPLCSWIQILKFYTWWIWRAFSVEVQTKQRCKTTHRSEWRFLGGTPTDNVIFFSLSNACAFFRFRFPILSPRWRNQYDPNDHLSHSYIILLGKTNKEQRTELFPSAALNLLKHHDDHGWPPITLYVNAPTYEAWRWCSSHHGK